MFGAYVETRFGCDEIKAETEAEAEAEMNDAPTHKRNSCEPKIPDAWNHIGVVVLPDGGLCAGNHLHTARRQGWRPISISDDESE